jgi:hypothetical protein
MSSANHFSQHFQMTLRNANIKLFTIGCKEQISTREREKSRVERCEMRGKKETDKAKEREREEKSCHDLLGWRKIYTPDYDLFFMKHLFLEQQQQKRVCERVGNSVEERRERQN